MIKKTLLFLYVLSFFCGNTINAIPHILPAILNRKTTRSFVKDGKMKKKHIHNVLKAACRAPSAWNGQPWRFWYAHTSSPEGQKLQELLLSFNGWAKDAEWLMLVGADSKLTHNEKVEINTTAQFDTGAACENLALQATAMGFGCAVVGGFDHKKAAALINNSDIQPCVMIALGSKEKLHKQEPTPRLPMAKIAINSF